MIVYLLVIYMLFVEYKLGCTMFYCSDVNASVTSDSFKIKDKSKFDIGDKSQVSVSINYSIELKFIFFLNLF